MQILRQLPNLLTLLRLGMTVPIAWLLLEQQHAQALIWFALAGASDGLDGFLARRYGWVSRFGSLVDPLADKLLLVTSYICLSIVGELPVWLTLVVLGRDLLLVVGAIVYRTVIGPFGVRPSLLGKLSTLLQIVLVLALLLELSIQPAFVEVHGVLEWLVLLVTLASGADYCRVWLGKFISARREPVR
ncbi:cardiolipin synthase [Pseudomonas pohangensis]|jgi:cardiolipin synthase|uniref:CDP-diacylglycerol--glycerol-3-phosphate 3-phosphatidyltransferase n=1 Tax=Pseudomonas pohangensis TaxID=364197 RepID=A0A1H2G538_9PSED|nr:CDP-alcohol phosphatidyltransferase family protein [Pseudomonas pohangensis]SDU14756.1 cardiolipin synthase [Pseudomonas pohangensis]